MWVFINDQFHPEQEASVSVFDQGLLYGDGVFETVRVHLGQLKFLNDHLARLRESCHLIRLPLPPPVPVWRERLQELCERNALSEAVIRITITRGTSSLLWESSNPSGPTIIMFSRPLPNLPLEQRIQGVPIVITNIRRQSPLALPSHMKSLNFLNNIMARQEATGRSAYDGLMLNMNDHLAECSTSNVFFVKQNRLCTPSTDCGILPGVTRKIILERAQELGIPIEEGRYARNDLYQATECFLTNTGVGILPVAMIDTYPMGPYDRNSITHQLQHTFAEYLKQNI